MKTEGRCLIDVVEVGEATLNMLGPSPTLIAKYRLHSSSSGVNVGPGNRNQWGEKTFEKLRELVDAMEADIARDIFDEGSTISGVVAPIDTTADGVPGL